MAHKDFNVLNLCKAFSEWRNRISLFVNLPFESLDRLRLQEKLDEIGQLVLPETEAVAE
ncbi:MAG: hypothetical protein U9R74_04625 [Pseudomonadota bacterium]|nr:hypothetical protein [Pseudomonadota bacterium]